MTGFDKLRYQFRVLVRRPYSLSRSLGKTTTFGIDWFWISPFDVRQPNAYWTSTPISSGKTVGLRLHAQYSVDPRAMTVSAYCDSKLDAEERIEQSQEAKDSKSILADVPVENIQPGKITARRTLNGKALDELASSIQEHGLIERLVLRPAGNGYEIVAGARRFLAPKRVGVKTLPATIRDLSDSEAFELLVAENLQPEDLNPLEVAYLLKQAVEKLGYSQRQLARRIGKVLQGLEARLRPVLARGFR
jgi:ParB/RepB/Spo0J family partition protein